MAAMDWTSTVSSLGGVLLGGALASLVTSRERGRVERSSRHESVSQACAALLVAAMMLVQHQRLLRSPAMAGHLRWRGRALEAHLARAEDRLQALLTAKTAVDLIVSDDEFAACADALLETAVAASEGKGEDATWEGDLKRVRLEYLGNVTRRLLRDG